MSTYSWSYKTATHRQVSAKRAETEQETPDKNGVCQIESDKTVYTVRNSASQDNSTVGTGTTKRLNWKAKIYVGNLNKKTNEASLAYYFSVFGDIEDIKLIRDHDTKESRGFAFITFEKIESAEKAKKWCSFNYPSLDDNSITVAHAERKTHKIKITKNEQLAKRDPSQTLFWEFKWKNNNDAQVYGPYETSLMQAWKNQGYFDGGCWVRQVLYRQVCRGEEIQEAKTKVSEGDLKDETFEASPCKKPKLVMDYSDSEDETEEIVEQGGVALDAGGRSRHGDGGNEEECGNNGLLEDGEGYESSRAVVIGVSEIKKEQHGGEEGKWKEIYEKMDGKPGRVEDVKNNVETHATAEGMNESNHRHAVEEMKHGEIVSSGILLQVECAHLRQPENDVKKDSSLNEVRLEPNESNHKLSGIETIHEEVKCKNLAPPNNEAKETDINEANPVERELGESFKETNDTVIICGDNLKHSEHHVLTLEDNKPTEITGSGDHLPGDCERSVSNAKDKSFDILQLYEKGATVLPENDEHGEQKVNDEDLPSDYTSSEEEDIDNDTGNISTEFVAISEIDFNLYP